MSAKTIVKKTIHTKNVMEAILMVVPLFYEPFLHSKHKAIARINPHAAETYSQSFGTLTIDDVYNKLCNMGFNYKLSTVYQAICKHTSWGSTPTLRLTRASYAYGDEAFNFEWKWRNVGIHALAQ